jgi:hypothetical protein
MLLMRALARYPLGLLGAIALAFGAIASTACADPVERVSTQSDQRGLNVTIYNGGASLIHDRRRVTFAKGLNRIAWRDVSGMLDPTSAVLRSLTPGDALAVVEQNFDFSLLTPTSLLAKYVGRNVTVVHDVAIPGYPRRERARLLSNNDGVVLQYADRIETSLDGSHIVFDAIPGDLRDRPTLLLDLESSRPGPRDVDLAYMSNGLGWQADYVGTVSADKTHMDLNGLVTLTNTSGTTYPNARLQLVAGNVNLNQDARPMGSENGVALAAVPAPMQQENYFEYHLYTLARPTTIANGQTKQVALLSARNVPIKKTLELRGSDSYYSNANADLGAKLPVGAYVTFTNKGGDLGIPLPGGLVRLYANDSRGTSQFLGSDRIDHTPKNEGVRLHVGDSFDVTANKKQTNFTALGNCTFESSYDIRLANAKDVPQVVDVVEPIPGDWKILTENFPHEKTSSATSTWHIRVPADSNTTLTYSARVRLCF